jgi:hypothetical protein
MTMSHRTLVDEAAELIDCLSTDEKKQLFQRIPGMQARVFRKQIRFIWHAPIGAAKRAMSRPTRATLEHPDDIV